jgi:hypothetical protein
MPSLSRIAPARQLNSAAGPTQKICDGLAGRNRKRGEMRSKFTPTNGRQESVSRIWGQEDTKDQSETQHEGWTETRHGKLKDTIFSPHLLLAIQQSTISSLLSHDSMTVTSGTNKEQNIKNKWYRALTTENNETFMLAVSTVHFCSRETIFQQFLVFGHKKIRGTSPVDWIRLCLSQMKVLRLREFVGGPFVSPPWLSVTTYMSRCLGFSVASCSGLLRFAAFCCWVLPGCCLFLNHCDCDTVSLIHCCICFAHGCSKPTYWLR